MRGIFRILAALLLVALSACSAPRPPCLETQRFCVGLVTSTAGLDDHGLNASAWEGVQRALQDGSIRQADVIESVDSRDYGKNIAVFAAQGYDLIITAGAGLGDDTREAAAQNPDLHFLGLGQEVPAEPLPNLQIMTLPTEQGGFLAGALAALVSHTGIVAAVCETSGIESMWRYCEGFRLGAQYEKKDITVIVIYHEGGSPDSLFMDEAWGSRTARSMLGRGADVIFGVGGRLGQGALRTAAEAGAWSIGAEQDQFYATPEARLGLLSSAVPQAAEAVRSYIAQTASGAPPGETRSGMILAPWHEGEQYVPLSVQAALQGLQTSLEIGAVPVNVVQPR